jgi:tetratricopeptide (TPR) repeat protein
MRHTTRILAPAAVILAAITLGRAADPISTTDAELQYQLGNLLSNETRYHEALAAFEKAAGTGDKDLSHRARKGKVRTALVIAEFATARHEADALRQELPADPETLTLDADALWASGLFDEADETYRAVLAMNPGSSRARFGAARSLATRNRLSEALGEALAASSAAPRDGEIHFEVGDIYERLHRYPEAATAYTNYINLLPNKDRSERAAWARTEVTFLHAFDGKTPMQIDGNPDGPYTVPFRVVSGKVLVEARINGSALQELVLDTGSEETVIAESTARRLNIRPITYTLSAGIGEVGLRGLQLSRLNSLQIGSLKIENVPVLIKSPGLNNLPKREPDSFSPLALGLSVTVDYQRSIITMGGHIPAEQADFTLPMRMNRLAMVRGTLNDNQPAYFVVDTGGEVISISTVVAASLKMAPVRRIPLKVYGMSGWDRDAFLLPGVDLRFNDLRYANLPVVVLNLRTPSVLLGFEVGGIVGHKFLEKYRATMDLDRSELRLARF